MGSFCSVGLEKERPKRLVSYNSIEEIRFNAGLFIQENQDEFSKTYNLNTEPIGYGAYGEVWICEHVRSKEKRAVKIIEKSTISPEVLKSRGLLEEVEILRSLDHPNILKIFEYFEDYKNFYIVMEYSQHGDLFDELQKRGKFDEQTASKIMQQIFAGVNYFHNKLVVHRDLKLENILISKQDKDVNIKIIDFNIATVKTSLKLSKFTGTFNYIAPEVIDEDYDEKCDLWSCGVILFLLLTGEFPFFGKDRDKLFSCILNGKYQENPCFSQISSLAKDLISHLLCKNLQNRYSAREALNHPWIETFCPSSDHNFYQRTLTRMLSIKKKPKLREMFETFLLGPVQKNDSELKELEKVFFELDVDRNGMISIHELFNKFKTQMPEDLARKEAERILRTVDNDCSGQIDYTEFLRAALEEESYVCKENLIKAFYYFDKNSSGSIDKVELSSWLAEGAVIPMEVIEQLIEEADKNGDGVIDLEEFQTLLLDRIAKEENSQPVSQNVSFEDSLSED
jgi:calcium-dependent protein kinase